MPRIIDSVATTEAALVFSDRHSILFDDDPISIRMNLDGAADGRRQDRVLIMGWPALPRTSYSMSSEGRAIP